MARMAAAEVATDGSLGPRVALAPRPPALLLGYTRGGWATSSDDAAQFLGAEQTHDAVGHGDDGVVGISACGEGVGGFFGDDADARLGDAGAGGQFFDYLVEIGGFLGGELAGVVHGEDDLVGEPVASHIHDEGEPEGEDDARTAAEEAAEDDDDGGKQGQQHYSLELACHKRVAPL